MKSHYLSSWKSHLMISSMRFSTRLMNTKTDCTGTSLSNTKRKERTSDEAREYYREKHKYVKRILEEEEAERQKRAWQRLLELFPDDREVPF